MNRYIAIILLAVFWGCSHEVENNSYPVKDKIVLLNSLAESFSIINKDSDSIKSDVVLTGNAPNQIIQDGDYLYLVNSFDNNVLKYDVSNFKLLSEIYLGKGLNPYMMDIDDSYIYVSCWLTNELKVIDKVSEEVVKTVSVGSNPQGVLSVDGNVYVTNVNYTGSSFGVSSFSLIDIDTMEIIKTVELPYKNPQTLFYVESRGEIHIIFTGIHGESDGGVAIVKDGVVIGSFDIGGSPFFSEGGIGDDKVFLSDNGCIRSYDLSTLGVYEPHDIDYKERITSSIVVGDKLYMSTFETGKILVYNKDSLQKLTELQGSNGAQQLLYIK